MAQLPPAPRPGGLGEQVVNSLAYAAQLAVNATVTPLVNIISQGFTVLLDVLERQAVGALRPYLVNLRNTPGMPSWIVVEIDRLLAPQQAVQLAAILGMAAMAAIGAVLAPIALASKLVTYEAEKQVHSYRLDPQASVQAWIRGLVSEPWARDELSVQGLDETRQNVARGLSEQLIDVTTLQELLRRGLVTRDGARDALRKQGWNDNDATNLVVGAERLPDLPVLREGFLRGYISEPAARGAIVASGVSGETADTILRLFKPLLGVGDIVSARARGFAADGALPDDVRATGLDSSRLSLLIRLAQQQLGLSELMQLRNRGDLTTEQAKERLIHSGLSADDADQAIKLFTIIPGPQDLISMAVREAFNDDAARKLGTDSDFPQAFAEWAPRVGLSSDWAKRYWRAHWQLPSATQGYEMLHRGLLNPDQLTDLLTYLDVMPFYRDKLIQMQYSPITRVDIRRLYDQGILTTQQVKQRYKAIGYNEPDAQALTEYTVSEHNAANRDLTKADLINGYKTGILSNQLVLDSLLGLGYEQNEAEYYIVYADYQLAQAENKDKIEIIHQRYIAKEIDESTARSSLTALQLTAVSVDRYLLSWRAGQRASPTRLTMSQLSDLWRKGIINTDQVESQVSALGYPSEQQEWLIESLTVAGPEKVRLPSLSDLRAFLRAGIITSDGFTSGLAKLDYSAEDITRYVAAATIKTAVVPKLPSAGQLARFLTADAIDLTQYRAAMRANGYTPEVIEWFVRTVDVAEVPKDKMLSVGQLRAFYRAKVLTLGQFEIGLTALGYSATDVARFAALEAGR